MNKPEKKILTRYKTNLDYHFSEFLEKPYAKPYWIYISLSHKCTYKCRMCDVVKIFQDVELEKDVILRVLDEIARWQRDCVLTFTGGEPFLRKDIFEVMTFALKKGLRVEVVSNGSLMDQKLAERIVSLGLDNVAISLDGAKAETHDFVRQEGSFKKALEAIQLLSQAKRKIGHGPQISVWTTIMKENVEELFDVIDVVKPLGVECLVYHPVIVAQCDMQNTSGAAPFWLRGEKLDELKKQIDVLVAYREQHGLVAFLHDPYLWIKYFEQTIQRENWKCNPFVFINIGPDGYVRSCGPAFGNLYQKDFESCLETNEAFDARSQMKKCQKPCLQTCWAHPDSDSLPDFTQQFVDDVQQLNLSAIIKQQIFKKALDEVEYYEKKVMVEEAAKQTGLKK